MFAFSRTCVCFLTWRKLRNECARLLAVVLWLCCFPLGVVLVGCVAFFFLCVCGVASACLCWFFVVPSVSGWLWCALAVPTRYGALSPVVPAPKRDTIESGPAGSRVSLKSASRYRRLLRARGGHVFAVGPWPHMFQVSLGVDVRVHLHLMPSLLPCRTWFTACACRPVRISFLGVAGGSRLFSCLVDAAMQVD